MVTVGWYHSHPFFKNQPSQIDVDNHKSYKVMLGMKAYVGIIISPYNKSDIDSQESPILIFDELKGANYQLKYEIFDSVMDTALIPSINQLAHETKGQPGRVNLSSKWTKEQTYLWKLQAALKTVITTAQRAFLRKNRRPSISQTETNNAADSKIEGAIETEEKAEQPDIPTNSEMTGVDEKPVETINSMDQTLAQTTVLSLTKEAFLPLRSEVDLERLLSNLELL